MSVGGFQVCRRLSRVTASACNSPPSPLSNSEFLLESGYYLVLLCFITFEVAAKERVKFIVKEYKTLNSMKSDKNT